MWIKRQLWSKIIVLAAFAALASALHSTADAAPRRPPPPDFQLNLSAAQRQRLDEHMKETHAGLTDVKESLRKSRFGFYDQLRSYKLNQRRAEAAATKINSLQLRLLNLNLDNQIALRDILTKDQFTELTTAIRRRGGDADGGVWLGEDGINLGEVNRLGLSQSQQDRIKKLFDRSKSIDESNRKQFQSSAEALEKLYLNYDLDAKDARARIIKLNNSQSDLLKAIINRQMELRKILTEKQFQTLVRKAGPPKGPPRNRGAR